MGPGARIELFTDISGGRTLLAANRLAQSECTSVGSATFCDWGDPLTLSFGVVAKSMVISGADESFMLDNLSLIGNEATLPGQLPEPASLALALSAPGVLDWSRKRAGAL